MTMMTQSDWDRLHQDSLAEGLILRPQEDKFAAPHETDSQAPEDSRGPFTLTHSGQRFFLLDPRLEEVRIADIAHSLAMQCRWTGHTRRFLSIAEHSVHVSRLCPTLSALLHDAPEAYLGDCSRPLKHAVPDLVRVEKGIWAAVALKFDLPCTLSATVHHADQTALADEIVQGFVPEPWDFEWERLPKSSRRSLIGHCPQTAERQFLARFKELST